MEILKNAEKTATEASAEARKIVIDLLEKLKKEGTAAAIELARKFDNWDGDIILSPEKRDEIIATVPELIKKDIQFAHKQVSDFAKAQRQSIKDFSLESMPGVRLGQKAIPVDVAGCYVPGGRYAYACSALMSIATAKAAGVPFVVASCPATGSNHGIAPATVYAMHLAGADVILQLGGVQAIAALAYGLFTGKPANIIAGPGNAYVAEAKSILCGTGQCGIDVFAGPSESAIIADDTADPTTIAIDLLSQAEHGVTSPVWLFTTSRRVGEEVARLMPLVCGDNPDPEVPLAAWRNYGKIILCNNREEAVRISDEHAPEHLHVQAKDLDWWLDNLHNYGSLFLGEGSTVPQGDKCTGPNHILPTKKAGLHSGGLSVIKFLKILTHQQVSPAANAIIGATASRLCRIEGMEGHARACDWRLRKYFPEKEWDFKVYKHPKF